MDLSQSSKPRPTEWSFGKVKAQSYRKVMVFGVFDGLHEGHRYFLREAKALGDYLTVVVAQDESVKHAKGRLPKFNVASRIATLQAVDGVDEVVAGDEVEGSWNIVSKCQPNVIAIGYDQQGLREALRAAQEKFIWKIAVVTIAPHEPEKYKSSLM